VSRLSKLQDIVLEKSSNSFKLLGLSSSTNARLLNMLFQLRNWELIFLSIDGFEAAGHIGETDIPNTVLLRRAAQSLKIPFVASGGFADGEGLAAALAMGACGVNIGTRFMSTVESPIHHNIKKTIVEGSENDTELLLRKFKNTSRLHKNTVAVEAKKIETEKLDSTFGDVQHLVSGQRGKRVFIDGDPNAGVSALDYRTYLRMGD
jgi:NAD(P)H-dependent flavin oxidoreductase YrpB (nitropropane dioxygenase family)